MSDELWVRGVTLPNEAIPIKSKKEIKKGYRLFYQLTNKERYREIEDVPAFLKKDKRMSRKDFIAHHNFHIIKQTNHD